MAIHSISLCSGVGGLDLGLHLAIPDLKPLVYVERDIQASNILVTRLEGGSLPEAPIWSDISTFDATPFRGLVDILFGGLPCQPFSVAGKREGVDDERYIWPEFFRILRESRPSVVFLENVPPFVSGGYFRAIGEELSDMGYRIERPLFVSASDVGASHQRKRTFIMAYSASLRYERLGNSWRWRNGSAHEGKFMEYTARNGRDRSLREDGGRGRRVRETDRVLANTECSEWRACDDQGRYSSEGTDGQGKAASGSGEFSGNLADTSKPGLEKRGCERRDLWQELKAAERGSLPLFAPGPSDEQWPTILAAFPQLAPAVSDFERRLLAARCAGLLPMGVECTPKELGRIVAKALAAKEVEPDFWRVADGLAFGTNEFSRVDRLRGIGNGVVALQGALAFIVLARRAGLNFGNHERINERSEGAA